MTYTNIFELPSQVTSSLDEKDAIKWMDAFNSYDPKTKDEVESAKRKAWLRCKDLPSSFSFCAKASVDAIDKDREIVDVESVKKHLDSFIEYGGNLQWEHQNYNVGTIWDWNPVTVNGVQGVEVWGNLFGGDAVYDQMRKSFVEGKNSLSVAGEAGLGRYQCDSRGCYMRRNVKQLMEVSLCKVPANKFCTLTWYNEGAKLTKSVKDDGIRMGIEEYTIHKDYTSCPIQSLVHDLQNAGFADARATRFGAAVPMDRKEYDKCVGKIRSKGLCSSWMPMTQEALICDREEVSERLFKSLYNDKVVNEKGELSPSMWDCAGDILSYCTDNGLIEYDDATGKPRFV